MANKKKAEEAKSQPDNVKVIIQPDGTKYSLGFLDELDALVLAIYENKLPDQDKAKIDQDPVFLSKLESYIRNGIIQLDMPPNNIQLNENQKKIREYWFKDASEDAIREQVLGTERYQYWKQTGSIEPPPQKAQASPASENMAEANTTLNVETNIHVEKEEKTEEEKVMFNNTQNNQNGQQAQAQQQNGQQQQGNILTDALGAVDEFTDHWYGKAAIAGGAAFATYKFLSSKSEDPDYSSAGDDAVSDYGGNFF